MWIGLQPAFRGRGGVGWGGVAWQRAQSSRSQTIIPSGSSTHLWCQHYFWGRGTARATVNPTGRNCRGRRLHRNVRDMRRRSFGRRRVGVAWPPVFRHVFGHVVKHVFKDTVVRTCVRTFVSRYAVRHVFRHVCATEACRRSRCRQPCVDVVSTSAYTHV